MNIKPKEKKCKGTGTAKDFGCGELQFERVHGLGKYCGCYNNWLLNSEAGKEKLNRSILKVTEPRRSLERAIQKEKESKGIQSHLKNTKVQVHEMVRLRDYGLPCISCGCQWNERFQAGHYFRASNYLSIKFHFLNINGQCEGCNLMKDGNHEEYKQRLPERIGIENFKIIEELAEVDHKFNKNWTTDELKNIRKEAKKITNELKK